MSQLLVEEETRVLQPTVWQRRLYLPQPGLSRGELDEINPDDVIYGEYTNGPEPGGFGEYIDLIYKDGQILRYYSGPIPRPSPNIDELFLLLRDDKKFYVINITEVKYGFAFKSTEIIDIKTESMVEGTPDRDIPPSSTWTLKFNDGSCRGVETNFVSYFTYGKTTKPSSVTNAQVLDDNIVS